MKTTILDLIRQGRKGPDLLGKKRDLVQEFRQKNHMVNSNRKRLVRERGK